MNTIANHEVKKTYYIIYKTTNLINNKIYIGAHTTDNLNDSYMGSGKILTEAIKKYGVSNFKKEILEYCDSAISMYKREKEIVNLEFIKRPDTYNLKVGGDGGFSYLNSKEFRDNTCYYSKVSSSLKKYYKECKEDPEKYKELQKRNSIGGKIRGKVSGKNNFIKYLNERSKNPLYLWKHKMNCMINVNKRIKRDIKDINYPLFFESFRNLLNLNQEDYLIDRFGIELYNKFREIALNT